MKNNSKTRIYCNSIAWYVATHVQRCIIS